MLIKMNRDIGYIYQSFLIARGSNRAFVWAEDVIINACRRLDIECSVTSDTTIRILNENAKS